jgi:heavy metal sensor kinase
MLKSLRARLLAWYAVVLAAVLITFATLVVWSSWRASVRDLDARLSTMASQLAGVVVPDPSGGYEVNLADESLAALGVSDEGPYYAIWGRDQELIDRSDLRIGAAFPGGPQTRTRNGQREVLVQGDDNTIVLVGQSLDQVRSDRWAMIVTLTVAGGAALVLASIGGWFLVGRALAPVGRIAQTAEAMSESNLGLRIDIERTEDELGSVAAALNRAFDRLQEAFERQTRFTADASHELRTPLASLMAEIEWALARTRSQEEYQHSLRVAMKAAERMRAVVEGLLTLAKADAGAVLLQRQSVDLSTLTQEVVSGLEPLALERGIRLEVAAEAAVVTGDPDRLRELITNLVANAVRYCSPGGHVSCSARVVGNGATLEVSDTGPGIDAEDLPHIFERFYRANKARSRVAGGAGLGLAISKWIVESHGGRIWCDSTPAHGACFIVELPIARVV